MPDGVASLRRMRDKLCSNPRSRTRAPEFMAVVTGNGEYARMVEDGIYVIPIRLLEKQRAHVDNGSACAFYWLVKPSRPYLGCVALCHKVLCGGAARKDARGQGEAIAGTALVVGGAPEVSVNACDVQTGNDVAKGPMGQQGCNFGCVAAALAVVAAFQEACDVGQIERAVCAVSSVRGRNDAALLEVAYAARRETGQFGHDSYFEIHSTPPFCRWRMLV